MLVVLSPSAPTHAAFNHTVDSEYVLRIGGPLDLAGS